MIISFEKDNAETKIYTKFGDKQEKFEYLSFLNYLFLGKTLEDIIFSDNFSTEEKKTLTKMIKNINNSVIKKDDILKKSLY